MDFRFKNLSMNSAIRSVSLLQFEIIGLPGGIFDGMVQFSVGL